MYYHRPSDKTIDKITSFFKDVGELDIKWTISMVARATLLEADFALRQTNKNEAFKRIERILTESPQVHPADISESLKTLDKKEREILYWHSLLPVLDMAGVLLCAAGYVTLAATGKKRFDLTDCEDGVIVSERRITGIVCALSPSFADVTDELVRSHIKALGFPPEQHRIKILSMRDYKEMEEK